MGSQGDISQSRMHWQQAFAGHWQLDRVIEDRRAGQVVTFAGEARFDPLGDGLAYREDGELRLPGQGPLRAQRIFNWKPGENGMVNVFFEDGRFFHHFDPSPMQAMAEHPCAPDHYRVAYDFEDWPRWSATWDVSGPAKDYTLASTYLPC